MDLRLLAPEIVVLSFAIGVLMLDLLTQRRAVLLTFSALGLLIAAVFTLPLIGEDNGGTTFNGMLIVDDFSIFFKFLFLLSTLLVILASVDYSDRFRSLRGEYYALLLFACAGMMLMASTGELISIYISLEITGISLYALAGLLKDGRSSEAGIKFLLLGALSSAVLLYGMAIFFGLTGTTNLLQMGPLLVQSFQENRLPILLATVLLMAGFGFKLATVPFQMWVPDVYEGAPTPVTAFLSVASKAAGFAVVLRVFHSALGQEPLTVDWATVFAVLSALSMTLGNIVAIQQQNIKRMMGYSSIAHAGFIMVGLAVVPQIGPSGVLFYLISYALTNLGAFIAIIALSEKLESDLIADCAGVWHRAPLLALGFAFCLLSLVGIPPTAGFFAKLFIFNAGVQQGLLWLVLVGVVNSAISAYYYVGVIKTMFLDMPASREPLTVSIPLALALFIATVGTFALGIFPGPAMSAATAAASSLAP